MDYAAFVYLNPDVCFYNNISTVEGAKFYLDALPPSELAGVNADLSVVPEDFDPGVYVADGGLRLNVSLIDSVLRTQAKNEGLTQAQLEHNQEYADNLIQHLSLTSTSGTATLNFAYSTFMTTENVMAGDRVRVLVNDSDYFRAVVTAIDYTARTLSLERDANGLPLPVGAREYRLYGVLVTDVRRIAVINYVRRATDRTAQTSFDPDFNLRLYQLLYPDSRLMERDSAYVDYLGRMKNDDFRVGKEPDIFVNRPGYTFPPLKISDLEVTGETRFIGRVTFCNESTFLGDVEVDANIDVGSNFTVKGSGRIEGDFDVGGACAFSNRVTMCNDLDVIGNTNLHGRMDVSGPTTLSNTLYVK